METLETNLASAMIQLAIVKAVMSPDQKSDYNATINSIISKLDQDGNPPELSFAKSLSPQQVTTLKNLLHESLLPGV